jgi:hypothetical protein
VTAAKDAQIAAARPSASSWVAANAGSGKTRVLTDRVARLLLAGTEPSKILCLTYTKAAAAEMQTRLFRTLGAWAMMPEAELRAALTDLGEPGEVIAADRLDRARTLFARALETPGGLKVQTIHAFCDALLRRYPLEAGVPPQFAVLEDRQARALRADTLDALAEADCAEFTALARHLSDDDVDALLQEIAHHRSGFADDCDAVALATALGAEPGLTPAALVDGLLTSRRAGAAARAGPRAGDGQGDRLQMRRDPGLRARGGPGGARRGAGGRAAPRPGRRRAVQLEGRQVPDQGPRARRIRRSWSGSTRSRRRWRPDAGAALGCLPLRNPTPSTVSPASGSRPGPRARRRWGFSTSTTSWTGRRRCSRGPRPRPGCFGGSTAGSTTSSWTRRRTQAPRNGR